MTDPHHQAARLAAQQAFMESLARLQETLQLEATDLAAELIPPEAHDDESPEAACPPDSESDAVPPSCTIHPLAQAPPARPQGDRGNPAAAGHTPPNRPVADSAPDPALAPLPEPSLLESSLPKQPLDPIAQSLRDMEAAIADLERVNPPPPPSATRPPAPPPAVPPPPRPRRSPPPAPGKP